MSTAIIKITNMTTIIKKNSGRNIISPIAIKGSPIIAPIPLRLIKKPTSTASIPAILVPLLTIIQFSSFYLIYYFLYHHE